MDGLDQAFEMGRRSAWSDLSLRASAAMPSSCGPAAGRPSGLTGTMLWHSPHRSGDRRRARHSRCGTPPAATARAGADAGAAAGGWCRRWSREPAGACGWRSRRSWRLCPLPERLRRRTGARTATAAGTSLDRSIDEHCIGDATNRNRQDVPPAAEFDDGECRRSSPLVT